MKTNWVFIIALIGIFLAGNQLSAQTEKFQAAYIFNICKYVEWPAEYRTGNFVIGVLDAKSKVIPELQTVAKSKQLFGQTIEVKVFASASDITKCHAIFIPENQSSIMENVMSKIDKVNTLVFTEAKGATNKGAGVNFLLVGGKLQFELHKGNITQKGLKYNPELEKLATKVY